MCGSTRPRECVEQALNRPTQTVRANRRRAGGSSNAYTYTTADPVNTTDLSGEWAETTTYNYEAAETGPAHPGPGPEYAPGAIVPPPVNMQIQEEFAAHPPWDAVAVSNEAGEGGGAVADEGGRGAVAVAASAGVGGGAYAFGKPRHRKRVNVRIRRTNGSWTKALDTYCGIVGGAALTPGVDIFGAPAEVGCAGYGVVRGVEAIVEAL